MKTLKPLNAFVDLVCRSDDAGFVWVDKAPDVGEVAEFSTQLLKEAWPMISMSDGTIVVNAMNGQWRFRPVGRRFGVNSVFAERVS